MKHDIQRYEVFIKKTTFVKTLYLKNMSCLRALLCLICPPLAVIDKGCGSIFIVALLTIFGWVPGVIGALIILNKND
jgi:uncharacterized membrane protein YqaE (UPF0057 family)